MLFDFISKKKNKIELNADDIGEEERAILLSLANNRKKNQLLEVE